MAPRTTRSKAKSAPTTTSNSTNAEATEQMQSLNDSDASPPQLMVVPKSVGNAAKIVSLPHPVTNKPTRFLYCAASGIHELSHIQTPDRVPRSWLLKRIQPSTTAATSENSDGTVEEPEDEERLQATKNTARNGYVINDANLLIAAPFDPLFLLTPLFAGERILAKPAEDHLDALAKGSPDLTFLLRQPHFRNLLQERLESTSELLAEHGVEAYRPDVQKLMKEIIVKAKAMTAEGIWPVSLEQAFVQKPLEAPVTNVVVTEVTDGPDENADANEGTAESKEKLVAPSSKLAPPEIVQLQRVKVAVDYILSRYTRADLRKSILSKINTSSIVDFRPLDDYVQSLQKLKAEAQALRDLSDNIYRKRGAMDDEAAEIRAEKRRKKEEEDKKKKQESRAMKDLKKVNTSGMKKLSSFFTKAKA